VLLQSDDWGRIGVRDEEGKEQLRRLGVRLGERPYDYYSLETAADVMAVRDMLKRHRDSTGRHACLVMNFLMANLDFVRMQAKDYNEIVLLPLTHGFPGHWSRPGLFEAYHQGIADRVFHPALHGLTHFCRRGVEESLAGKGEQRDLLRTFWKAETPYIHWRMPWVGHEYCAAGKAGFLSQEEQQSLVRHAAELFRQFFSVQPLTACAPGYRGNADTHAAWAECGVRVAQNGGEAPRPPHLDEYEMLNLYRTVDVEPSERGLEVEKYMELAGACFARGIPAIISVHSINFHSTLKDFRSTTLQALDELLFALEAKYPNLLYVHDADMYEIVTRGKYRSAQGKVAVQARADSSPPQSAWR
jgi:hypothetical protein